MRVSILVCFFCADQNQENQYLELIIEYHLMRNYGPSPFDPTEVQSGGISPRFKKKIKMFGKFLSKYTNSKMCQRERHLHKQHEMYMAMQREPNPRIPNTNYVSNLNTNMLV